MILPDNATPLEKALVTAFTELVYASENPYPELLNPATAPVEKLDYLAHERLITDWDTNATELEKRDTIQAAMGVSRIAGTRQAVQLALAPLGGTVQVQPWYEIGGAPYHLNLNVTVTRPINEQLTRRIHARLKHAMSARDTYQLQVGAILPGENHVAMATSATQHTIITNFIE